MYELQSYMYYNIILRFCHHSIYMLHVEGTVLYIAMPNLAVVCTLLYTCACVSISRLCMSTYPIPAYTYNRVYMHVCVVCGLALRGALRHACLAVHYPWLSLAWYNPVWCEAVWCVPAMDCWNSSYGVMVQPDGVGIG